MTFFSLSVIGVIQKMAPVFTLIAAYTFLKEKISKLDYALIFVATAASVLVTLGDANQGTNSYNYVCLFFLLLNPVFAGSSNIALRKLKKTSSQTLTSWTNIMQAICMGAPMVFFGQSFLYYPSIFTAVDWVMLLSMSLSTIWAQSCRLLAYQNQLASKLQVLGNLQMIYQFLFDVLLFEESFTGLQYLGIAIMVFTFVFDIYNTTATKAPKQSDSSPENFQQRT